MFIIVFYSVEDLWHFFNHIIYFIIIFILAHFGSFRSFTISYFADWLPPYFHSDVLLPFTKLPNYMSYIADSGAPIALRYLLVCSIALQTSFHSSSVRLPLAFISST